MRLHLFATGALAAVLTAAGPAAALDPSKKLSQIGTDSWQMEQGLPQNSVWSIVQTPDGYVWLATSEGLVRFDGVRMTVFDKRNTPAFRMHALRSIALAPDGSLWIGTEAGDVVRLRNGTFTAFGSEHGLPAIGINHLAAAGGGLWAGTDGAGLFRLSYEGGVVQHLTRSHGLPSDRILALGVAPSGHLLVATDRGLARLSAGSLRRVPELESLPIHSVLEAPDGTLWAGTERAGLVRIQRGRVRRWVARDGVHGASVDALTLDRHGSLWIGTGGGGLSRIPAGSDVVTSVERTGLSGANVVSIREDGVGNLWVGTLGAGLFRLRDGLFTTWGAAEGLPNEIARAVLETSDGRLLVGTEGGGLAVLAGGRLRPFRFPDFGEDVIYALAEGARGDVWVGSSSGGVFRLRAQRISPLLDRDGRRLPGVHSLLFDRRGRLWAGTWRDGLLRVDLAETPSGPRADVVSFGPSEGLPGARLLSVVETSGGGVAVGTRTGMAIVTGDGSVRSLTARDGLPNGFVYSILADPDGTLWIGTGGGGLCRLRQGKLSVIGVTQGLADDVVYGLVEDGRGRFWMSSNRGIFRAARSDLEAVADGRAKSLRSNLYGVADGMRAAECNSGSPSAIRGRGGRLWFPTIRGVVSVDPAEAIPTPSAPALVEEIVVDGEVRGASGGFRLPPGTGRVDFAYSAPGARAPERTLFRYRLLRLEEQFVLAGVRRTAYFSHLRAGDYAFEVSASDDEGTFDERTARVEFRVEPRFFETRLFSSLVVLAAVTLAAAAWAVRVRRLKARERVLVALVAQRTGELEREKERAEEASQAKSAFLANTSHELRTPLNAILGYSELLLEDEETPRKRQDLQKVYASGKHLLGLINDILDLSKIEAGKMELVLEEFEVRPLVEELVQTVEPLVDRQSNRLVVDAPLELGRMRSDSTKVRQIFYNLLANATKFTKDGTIRLTVSRDGTPGADAVVFEVCDSGIGMSPEQIQRIFRPFEQAEATTSRRYGGTGLGLAISRRFVEMLGGRIVVVSEEGHGSRFVVTLPADGPSSA